MIAEIVAKVSSEAWVGLSGVIFGSLLTTLGVWLTNSSNTKRLAQQLAHEERVNAQKIQKERLEELYILISHWANMFFGHYLQLALVMKGHIDYNQYNETISERKSEKVDFNRVTMIIDIYGAQLQSYYESILLARDAYNEIEALHKRAYLDGQPGHRFVTPAGDAQLKIAKACEELKMAIAKAARTS